MNQLKIVTKEFDREPLADAFRKAGLECEWLENFAMGNLGPGDYVSLFVTYKIISQLMPILFEFKRTKSGITIKLVVGESGGKRREIQVRNEQDFQQGAEQGIDEIHVIDDRSSKDE
jgi:hypothetical protein